jgi:hypothetical protein
MANYRELYVEAHKKNFQREYAEAWKDGYYSPPKFPNIKTANGLTTWVLNFVNWMGHKDFYRQNTTGRYKPGQKHKTKIYAGGTIEEKGMWLKSEKGTGHADLTGGIKGKRVSIEIKAPGDTIKEDQFERQQKARADGGIYEFISHPDDFIKIYQSLT